MQQQLSTQARAQWRTAKLIALTLCLVPAAHANSSWVNTQTHGFKLKNQLMSSEMQSGAPISIVVSLKLRNKAQLDRTIADMHQGQRPAISADEFMRSYAPTDAQVQSVVRHLSQSGFTHIQIASNRLLIGAEGNAAGVKTAFHTTLIQFNDGQRLVHANKSNAQVPAALGATVLSVLGLQNVKTAHIMARRAVAGAKLVPSGILAHDPFYFSTIYDGLSTKPASMATVGIIAQGDLSQTLIDLQQFQKSHKLTVPVSTVLTGPANDDNSGMVEWNMDSQTSIGAAGGSMKQLIFYVAPTLENTDLTTAYNQVVIDHKASVINVSLGECEVDSSNDGTNAAEDQIFESAVAQGQTFSVSSGDSGSDECGDGGTNQSYPAVSPYVMAIGGTTLSTDNMGKYVTETVWNGGGGGLSSTESAPQWQTQSGVLKGSTKRGVPDVAFDGDPASGASVIINGSPQLWGGTSLSAPIFTGIWARMQSIYGNQAGFAGAWIYKAGVKNPKVFHDITVGNNGAFSATPGWDYATGWGSIDIGAFNNVMNGGPGALK